MSRVAFLLVLSVVIDGQPGGGDPPIYVILPEPVNTTEGSLAHFSCAALKTVSISFAVNGEFVSRSSVFGLSLPVSVPFGSDGRLGNFTITASSLLNNNSLIHCNAFGTGSVILNTDAVILRVQGPLSAVGDLSYSFIDSSTVNISWSPPFTLPGTDITGYNISAFTDDPREPALFTAFTEGLNYELSLSDVTDSSCYGISVNISAYNTVDGETTTIGDDDPWYLPRAPSAATKSISANHEIMQDLRLALSINVSDLCIGECPLSMTVSLQYINGTYTGMEEYANIPFIQECTGTEQSQILTTNEVIELLRYFHYDVVVVYANAVGEFDINTKFSFDTYDLVTVRVLNSSDSRVCLECSFSSFSTDNAGCTVELVSSTNTISSMVTFSKPSTDTDSVEGCIHGLNSHELFIINVYDHGLPGLVFTSTTIQPTITPTTSIDMITTSTVTPSSVITSSSGDIAVYISVPVVIVIFIVVIICVIVVIMIFVIIRRRRNKEEDESQEGVNDLSKDQWHPPVDNNPLYNTDGKTTSAD